jgi:MFS family permease
MASRGVRAFAFSYLGVIFAIYLNQLGYATVTVGLVLSTAYASSAVLTAVWGVLSDRVGRKRILVLLAALTIVSNLIYIFFSHLGFHPYGRHPRQRWDRWFRRRRPGERPV